MALPSVCRLHVIVSRDAPRAVVFRRGPSKQVLLSLWDLERDTLEHGQWFKGRIYEERCDLSPRGTYLVYFAAKHRGPHPTWTAISKPPYFTALAMFPKRDTWGGGGLFTSERELVLNHAAEEMTPLEGSPATGHFRISPAGQGWPHGDRLLRDGWQCLEPGRSFTQAHGASPGFVFDPHRVYVRPHPKVEDLLIERRTTGMAEVDGPWEVVSYALVDQRRNKRIELGRLDWADWAPSGEFLYTRDGQLLRSKVNSKQGTVSQARVVADLAPLTFEPVEPPPEALRV